MAEKEALKEFSQSFTHIYPDFAVSEYLFNLTLYFQGAEPSISSTQSERFYGMRARLAPPPNKRFYYS